MNKKKLMVLIFVCVFNLILFNSAFATTFYVKNGGNDSASGTSDGNAWKSIARVNKYAGSPGFKDGDIIQFKRGDTWSNEQSIGASGNWGRNITLTIKDYGTGDKPWLNANLFTPIKISGNNALTLIIKNLNCSGMDSSNAYVARFSDLRNLTIDGLYFDGHYKASKFPLTSGLLIAGLTGKLEIKNCTVKNFIHPNGRSVWEGQDAHGIYSSFSESGGKTSGSYSIHDNVFGNVQADTIQLKGIAPPSTQIYNNEFYKYGENAIDLKNCANVEIYGNDFHNDKGTKAGGTGGGITDIITHYKDKNYGPHCSNITIRNNTFRDSDYKAIRLIDSAKNVVITRNYFKNMGGGILISDYSGVKITDNVFKLGDGLMESSHANAIELGAAVNHLSDVTVQYNTIYGSSQTRYGIRSVDNSKFSNINIKNNLVYLTRNNGDAYPLRIEDNGNPLSFYKNTLINQNHSNRVYINGSVYVTSEESQWRKNYDSQGLFKSDPLFASNPSSGDLTVSSSSPAIGTGTTMKAPYNNDSGSSSSDSLEAPILQVISTR